MTEDDCARFLIMSGIIDEDEDPHSHENEIMHRLDPPIDFNEFFNAYVYS